jgi:hypothetical protein
VLDPAQDSGEVDAVLEAFTASRLLPRSNGAAEITHDALLRAWPRLRGWLDDDQAGRILYSQFLHNATDWHDHQRDPAFLYRGARLAAVQQATTRWATDPTVTRPSPPPRGSSCTPATAPPPVPPGSSGWPPLGSSCCSSPRWPQRAPR